MDCDEQFLCLQHADDNLKIDSSEGHYRSITLLQVQSLPCH